MFNQVPPPVNTNYDGIPVGFTWNAPAEENEKLIKKLAKESETTRLMMNDPNLELAQIRREKKQMIQHQNTLNSDGNGTVEAEDRNIIIQDIIHTKNLLFICLLFICFCGVLLSVFIFVCRII